MSDQSKTKKELIKELQELQQKYDSLEEISDKDITERKQVDGGQLLVGIEAFQKAFKGHGAVMYVVDMASFFIVDANEAALKFYGYDRATMLTKRIPDLNMTPEQDIRTEIKKAVAEGRSYYVFKHRLSSGELRDVEIYANPISIRGKNYSFSIVHDITERKKAEEDLKKSEDKYRRFTENAQDMIYRMSLPSGKYEYVSPAVTDIYGYESEEWYNNPLLIEKVIPPNWEEYFQNEHAKLLAGNLSPTFEHPIIHKTGKVKWIHQRNVLISDEQGNAIAIEGIVTDITERKENEQKILKQNEQLKELNGTKDKFFSIISHDLKSPFHSILGLSNLLMIQIHDKNHEGIEKYTEMIQKSSHHALDLLTNLLEWSRSQSGRMDFNPEYFEIFVLINEVIKVSNDFAQQKSITISKKLPYTVIVFADKAMVSTIMRNLISNAIKFTNTGGKIVISTEQKQDELIISVSDNGVGIKKEELEKLFRIDESYSTLGTQNEKGTGLGLILCKEFMEKHGGKIWAESEEGKGSEFKFSMPLKT